MNSSWLTIVYDLQGKLCCNYGHNVMVVTELVQTMIQLRLV